MLIKFGRLRMVLTLLPRIPRGDAPQDVEILSRRIAIREKGHKKTSHLERRRAMAKFGVTQ